MHEIIRKMERKQIGERTINCVPGDTVSVSFRIKEGDKERTQVFQGVVMQIRGKGLTVSVTVRKSSGNVYVERIFPLYSPLVAELKVMKKGSVRRAKLYYLRKLTGKATRIKEKK